MTRAIHLVCVGSIALLSSGVFARPSFAQAPDVGVTATALVSIQPVNNDFVGLPYLDQGLGGVGPGFGAAFNVVTPADLVVSAEFSMASFEAEQEGRLVDGGRATGRLRDSLFSALIGQAFSSGGVRFQLVGGVSWLLDTPTQDGRSILGNGSEAQEFLRDGHSPVAFTGGADFLKRVSPRLSLVVTGRYSKLMRSRRAGELGIGSHMVRAGIGLRGRLNE